LIAGVSAPPKSAPGLLTSLAPGAGANDAFKLFLSSPHHEPKQKQNYYYNDGADGYAVHWGYSPQAL